MNPKEYSAVTTAMIRTERASLRGRVLAAGAAAGALISHELFDGTASTLVTAALGGVAVYNGLRSMQAGQQASVFRAAAVESMYRQSGQQ